MNFARVIDEVRRFSAARDTSFAVVGGVALAAYGLSRTTIDVDVLVPRRVQRDLVDRLENLGYRTINLSPGYSNHVHPEGAWGRVDVIYVDELTADKLFARVRNAPGPGGATIPVPSPEHLAAMKALAMKNDPDRRLRDAADVRELLRLPGVDRAAVRRSFARHGLEERFDDLATDFG